jgi:hypothetical protein
MWQCISPCHTGMMVWKDSCAPDLPLSQAADVWDPHIRVFYNLQMASMASVALGNHRVVALASPPAMSSRGHAAASMASVALGHHRAVALASPPAMSSRGRAAAAQRLPHPAPDPCDDSYPAPSHAPPTAMSSSGRAAGPWPLNSARIRPMVHALAATLLPVTPPSVPPHRWPLVLPHGVGLCSFPWCRRAR